MNNAGTVRSTHDRAPCAIATIIFFRRSDATVVNQVESMPDFMRSSQCSTSHATIEHPARLIRAVVETTEESDPARTRSGIVCGGKDDHRAITHSSSIKDRAVRGHVYIKRAEIFRHVVPNLLNLRGSKGRRYRIDITPAAARSGDIFSIKIEINHIRGVNVTIKLRNGRDALLRSGGDGIARHPLDYATFFVSPFGAIVLDGGNRSQDRFVDGTRKAIRYYMLWLTQSTNNATVSELNVLQIEIRIRDFHAKYLSPVFTVHATSQ